MPSSREFQKSLQNDSSPTSAQLPVLDLSLADCHKLLPTWDLKTPPGIVQQFISFVCSQIQTRPFDASSPAQFMFWIGVIHAPFEECVKV